MATEIVISLQNKPGALAKAAEVLGAAGVNFVGVGYVTGARGVMRVVADHSERALSALKAAKLKVKQTREVIELSLPNRTGALGETARKLAKGRVNLEAFYIVGAESGALQCIVASDKIGKAKSIVRG